MPGEQWLPWAVLSMLCYGFQSFLQRVARDSDAATVELVMYVVVCVSAMVAVAWGEHALADDFEFFLIFAALQGALYFCTSWSRMKALREGADSAAVFPLVRLSTVLVIVMSALILPRELESLQRIDRLSGILLTLVSAFLLIRDPGGGVARQRRISSTQWILIVLAIVASAGASLMAKGVYEVFDEVNVFAFILCSNSVSMIVAVGRGVQSRSAVTSKRYRTGVLIGFAMGAFNFAGVAAFMMALRSGTLSAVSSINALYVVVPVMLGAIVYREHLTLTRHLALAMMVVAIVLLAR